MAARANDAELGRLAAAITEKDRLITRLHHDLGFMQQHVQELTERILRLEDENERLRHAVVLASESASAEPKISEANRPNRRRSVSPPPPA